MPVNSGRNGRNLPAGDGLRLSKRTEYGLRAIVQLARLWPRQYVQSRDLAVQENLPNKFLESILLALRRATRKHPLPLGSFLAFAAIVFIIFQHEIYRFTTYFR